jgi:hypothetical protein
VQHVATEWLHKRFANTSPADFGQGVLFYTCVPTAAPVGFEHVWGSLNRRHRSGIQATAADEVISNAPAVLLIADVCIPQQLDSVIDMASFIEENFGEAAPPILLVLHSWLRTPVNHDAVATSSILALEGGIDEIVQGEDLEGIRLAWEVRARLFAQDKAVNRYLEQNESSLARMSHDQMVTYGCALQARIHDIIWIYGRLRIGSSLPAIDKNIPDQPQRIRSCEVGALVGNGSIGRVYKLNSTDSVLKVVGKDRLTNMRSLHRVETSIRAMSAVSERWPHPHIAKLHGIFHSRTHLIFEMQDAGPINLCQYLSNYRQQHQGLVSAETFISMVPQLMSAVCHMHLQANVVHLDLKPENIIVNEDIDSIHVCITDFDTAVIDPVVPCHVLIGTFPFTAPEVAIQGRYDPYANDIWSLGLVIVEALCFVKVVERLLQGESSADASNTYPNGSMALAEQASSFQVHRHFSQPDAVEKLLAQNMRPEIRQLQTESWLPMLKGMLQVDSAKRWRAMQVQSSMDYF